MKEECFDLPTWIQKISVFRDGQGTYERVTPEGSTYEELLSCVLFRTLHPPEVPYSIQR
jgi:hypothetical protein